MLLALLCQALTGTWATEVEIGTGTPGTTPWLPTYEHLCYSLTQQIYTAEEIGTACTINSFAFYTGDYCTRKLDVYMVHTNKNEFSSGTDWVVPTSANLVYSGDVAYTKGGWTIITLSTPFVYNGKDNLCLIVKDNTGSGGGGSRAKRYFVANVNDQSIKQSIYINSDYVNYDATNPTSYEGRPRPEKNQLKLYIERNYYLVKGETAHGGIVFTNTASEEITSAAENDVVTVTITPDEGWVVDQISGQWYAAEVAARNRAQDINLLNSIELTSAGTNTWTFTMKRAYAEVGATYKKLLTHADITIDIAPAIYNGVAQTPTVTVKDGTTTLVEGTDYTVSYSNSVNVGTATITVIGVGKYSGDVTKTFNIGPATITVSGITAEDKIYDGKTTATLNFSNVVLDGMVAGDNLSVTATGQFVTPDAGTDKPVTISELTLNGTNKDNYTLASSGNQSSTKGNITQKKLTIIAKPNTISFGDKPSNNGVTYEGFIKKEDANRSWHPDDATA